MLVTVTSIFNGSSFLVVVCSTLSRLLSLDATLREPKCLTCFFFLIFSSFLLQLLFSLYSSKLYLGASIISSLASLLSKQGGKDSRFVKGEGQFLMMLLNNTCLFDLLHTILGSIFGFLVKHFTINFCKILFIVLTSRFVIRIITTGH